MKENELWKKYLVDWRGDVLQISILSCFIGMYAWLYILENW